MALPKATAASSRTALVVDDNVDFNRACVRALSTAGFSVQSAFTEAEALEIIHRKHYDVAFIDIMLNDQIADRGGLNVISEMRKTNPHSKVIVISGADDVNAAVDAYNLGIFAFLQKHRISSPNEIVAAANRAMESERHSGNDTAAPPMREKFERLAAAWRVETEFTSAISEIFLNKNYQEIIGQGVAIVPFILEDLKRGPDHWYWALGAITGANPAEAAPPGDIAAISGAWLEWGRRKGIIR
jgi:ActR/RegA family two-component response regulator